MRVTVLVEWLDERRYRASTSHPITMESEGSSRDEAVERLRDQAAQRLNSGELVQFPERQMPIRGLHMQAYGKTTRTSMRLWKTLPTRIADEVCEQGCPHSVLAMIRFALRLEDQLRMVDNQQRVETNE